jgi:hypothetical protein
MGVASGNLRRLSGRTITRKNRLERKERSSRDTSLEYSTVDGVASEAADTKAEVSATAAADLNRSKTSHWGVHS